jgi:hypothetical protein
LLFIGIFILIGFSTFGRDGEDNLFWGEVQDFLRRPSLKKLFKLIFLNSLSLLLALLVILIPIILLLFFFKDDNNINVTEQRSYESLEYLNKYKSHSGSFPSDLEKMTGNSPARREWIKDGWGNPMIYSVTDNGNDFLLQSKGKDEKENTEDDLKFNKSGKI